MIINKASDLEEEDGDGFFFTIHVYSDVYSAYTFHLQRDANMISIFACNYPESH